MFLSCFAYLWLVFAVAYLTPVLVPTMEIIMWAYNLNVWLLEILYGKENSYDGIALWTLVMFGTTPACFLGTWLLEGKARFIPWKKSVPEL